MQSDRELREELEQLDGSIKHAEQELERWNTATRIAETRAALTAEVAELTRRAADAAVERDAALAQLREVKGELALSRSSLADARRSIEERQTRQRSPGCLLLLGVFPALSALAWALR
jgi:uncharacterized coiled-coil DUF342 family protein